MITFADAISSLRVSGLFFRSGQATKEFANGPSSWDEVLALIERDDELPFAEDWMSFEIERSNELATAARKASISRYNQWNEHSKVAVERVRMYSGDILAKTSTPEDIVRRLLPSVEWALVGAYLEETYADVSTVDFNHRMVQVLVGGFFPCGWDGEYPSGRPIVF